MMEKIKFSTGGQPVSLEDLELLQDNGKSLALMLLAALTDDKAKQFLMRRVEVSYQSITSNHIKVSLSGGILVVNGEFYPFDHQELTLSSLSEPIYLCLQNIEQDTRRFENNESKPCRVKCTAILSTVPTGVHYVLSDLRTVVELLRETLNIGGGTSTLYNVEVEFMNGYQGNITLSGDGDNLVLNVAAHSEQTQWSTSDGFTIFKIKDPTLAAKFIGKRGDMFQITRQSAEGNTMVARCMLEYRKEGAILLSVINHTYLGAGYLPPNVTFNATLKTNTEIYGYN